MFLLNAFVWHLLPQEVVGGVGAEDEEEDEECAFVVQYLPSCLLTV